MGPRQRAGGPDLHEPQTLWGSDCGELLHHLTEEIYGRGQMPEPPGAAAPTPSLQMGPPRPVACSGSNVGILPRGRAGLESRCPWTLLESPEDFPQENGQNKADHIPLLLPPSLLGGWHLNPLIWPSFCLKIIKVTVLFY